MGVSTLMQLVGAGSSSAQGLRHPFNNSTAQLVTMGEVEGDGQLSAAANSFTQWRAELGRLATMGNNGWEANCVAGGQQRNTGEMMRSILQRQNKEDMNIASRLQSNTIPI